MARYKPLPKGYSLMPDGRKRAHVKVNKSGQRVKVFPAGADDEEINVWRAEQRRDLLKTKVIKGTLAEDIQTYLSRRSAMPSFSDRTREIKMWLPKFGLRGRASILHTEIEEQVNDWAMAG